MARVDTDRLEYLQHASPPPPVERNFPLVEVDATHRRSVRVLGIGRERIGREHIGGEAGWRPAAATLLPGLYASGIPFAFDIGVDGAAPKISFGTWASTGQNGAARLDDRMAIMETLLGGLYPRVDFVPDVRRYSHALGGFVLGIPSLLAPTSVDFTAPVDRILRALTGTTSWRALLLARPVSESRIMEYRNAVFNDAREVASASAAAGTPSPLANQLNEFLQSQAKALSDGIGAGAWRTSVYLTGDEQSYGRLASVWRSVFNGPESSPEPVRVFDSPLVPHLAEAWAQVDLEGRPGPSGLCRPFEYQTLLSSAQLASYVHLPEVEAPGFKISVVPRFDSVVATPDHDEPVARIELGTILHNRRLSMEKYGVDLDALAKHVFVVGVTGAGKTNTVFSILRRVSENDVPFLVLEPAKTEYRALLRDSGLAGSLQVFTPGVETVAPLRLNPFQVIPTADGGYPVALHVDLLRALFVASFGMWDPLPQVLERCLYRIYIARGWDLVTNTNARLNGSNATAVFPTLTDLAGVIDDVVAELGYNREISDNLRGALRVRVESLRIGGRGRMLDVPLSAPFETLFEQPTVLELEGVGDDDNKAFIMGLLLMQLAAYRRSCGESESIRHLLVVEEAHRLLRNTAASSPEQGNPAQKAVEAFTNLLAEVRAYGQGVVISDQVPVDLAPAVLKNTNLKVVHRLVAADDREAVAGATAMTSEQAVVLASLERGEAAVFSEGDDAPLLVQIDKSDARTASRVLDDAAVREQAHRLQILPPRSCPGAADSDGRCCDPARALVDTTRFRRAFSRVVVSALVNPGALTRMWPDIEELVAAAPPGDSDRDELTLCVIGRASHWYADRRGAQAGWTYAATQEFERAVHDLFLEWLAHTQGDSEEFRLTALPLHLRASDPFPGCSTICAGLGAACLFRYPAADLVASRVFEDQWRESERNDGADASRPGEWDLATEAAYDLVECPESTMEPSLFAHLEATTRRAALCFAQQIVHADTRKNPRTVREVVRQLVDAHLAIQSDPGDV